MYTNHVRRPAGTGRKVNKREEIKVKYGGRREEGGGRSGMRTKEKRNKTAKKKKQKDKTGKKEWKNK